MRLFLGLAISKNWDKKNTELVLKYETEKKINVVDFISGALVRSY